MTGHRESSVAPGKRRTGTGVIIAGLAIWTAVSTGLIVAVNVAAGKPNARAVVLMGGTLALVWCAGGGLLARLTRDRIRSRFDGWPGSWTARFVVFCTLLALAEEAITTGLTNMAPLFGVPVGAAYITASADYVDVVCRHSVIVFVPMFAAWAWMLRRWAFHPNAVLLLFGLTGTLAEVSFSGPQQLIAVGFWTFVYGLMVYLPAYCVPADRGATPPRLWHYPMAVLLPFLWAIPVVAVVGSLHPVKIHFSPIAPGS